MFCPERLRLAHEYYVVVDVFRRSVQALIDLDGVEFHRAYEISETHRVFRRRLSSRPMIPS
jgi:hypothetical protein